MNGSCLCGQVRYEFSGEPEFVSVCHCTHCQKQTGSSFSLLAAVHRSSLKVEGTTKTFNDKGDSGLGVDRIFCQSCGSPVIVNPEVRPETTLVFVGTMSDRSQVAPTVQIFCDSKQPWLDLDGLQVFARMPPI